MSGTRLRRIHCTTFPPPCYSKRNKNHGPRQCHHHHHHHHSNTNRKNIIIPSCFQINTNPLPTAISTRLNFASVCATIQGQSPFVISIILSPLLNPNNENHKCSMIHAGFLTCPPLFSTKMKKANEPTRGSLGTVAPVGSWAFFKILVLNKAGDIFKNPTVPMIEANFWSENLHRSQIVQLLGANRRISHDMIAEVNSSQGPSCCFL